MDYVLFKSILFKRGLTQLELARRLDWPASRISLVLHGYRVASAGEAEALSKALEVGVPDLFPELASGKSKSQSRRRRVGRDCAEVVG